MLKPLLCAALLAATFFTPVSAETEKRPITHEDLWLMTRVGAPSVSPDGGWAVFSVTETAYNEKDQVSDLWIVSTDTPSKVAPRRLTGTAGGESGVEWSPDGTRIVFSAKREGDETAQLYLLDLSAGGEAQRLTRLVNGARAPKFSPDGKQIAFSSSDYPGAKNEDDNRRIEGERKARKWNARIYDGFPIRNWDRWLEDRKPRLFVINVPEMGATAVEPRELLRGSTLVREAGFAGRGGDGGDSLDATWAPDGEGLIFVASTDRHTAAFRFTSSNLWYVPLSGGEPVRLSGDDHSWSQPTFTPDGKTLIVGVDRKSDKVYMPSELVAIGWEGPKAGAVTLQRGREITRGIDRSVTSFAITPDSKTVYFLAEEAGHEKLFETSLANGQPRLAFDISTGV